MKKNRFSSHLEFVDSACCHVGCAQFEKQWPPENQRPLSHPLSKNFQFLSLWHAPSSHEVWIEQAAAQQHAVWIEDLKRQRKASPRLCHERALPKYPLLFWAASPMAQQWSASHGLCLVQSPTLETLRSIHDKKWLEKKRHKPLLSHLDSQIIHSFKELEQLSHKHPGQPWMIKRSWSAAGLGNRAYIPSITSAHFIEKWLAADQALIIQPLLEKKLDFSSLWYLPAQGSAVFLGSTQMLIENGTRYAGCLLQTPEHLFASYPFLWQEHLQEAQALMDQMRSEGYFGYLGLDGMLYETKHGLCQAIIEINLRQTLAMHLHSCAQSLEFAFPVLAQIKTERSKSSSPLFKRKQSLLPASYAIAIELYELHS